MEGSAIYGPWAKSGLCLFGYSSWTKNGFAFLSSWAGRGREESYFMTRESMWTPNAGSSQFRGHTAALIRYMLSGCLHITEAMTTCNKGQRSSKSYSVYHPALAQRPPGRVLFLGRLPPPTRDEGWGWRPSQVRSEQPSTQTGPHATACAQ